MIKCSSNSKEFLTIVVEVRRFWMGVNSPLDNDLVWFAKICPDPDMTRTRPSLFGGEFGGLDGGGRRGGMLMGPIL